MLQQGVRTGGESIVRSRRSPASLSTAAVRNAAVRERGGAGDAVVRAGPRDDAHCVGALLLARERCSCCSRGSARAARASCGVGGQRACPQHPAAVRSGPADDAHGVGALLLAPERCSCCSRGLARAARAWSGPAASWTNRAGVIRLLRGVESSGPRLAPRTCSHAPILSTVGEGRWLRAGPVAMLGP